MQGSSFVYNKALEDELPERTVVGQNFSNKTESLLTYVAYIIGPVNILYFPFAVLKYGGSKFNTISATNNFNDLKL